MAAAFSSIHWASAGPFFVQTSRILHYAVYFRVMASSRGAGHCGSSLRPSRLHWRSSRS
jgi:hypothetical protein